MLKVIELTIRQKSVLSRMKRVSSSGAASHFFAEAISTTIVLGHVGQSWSHYLLVGAAILSVSCMVLVPLLSAPKIAKVWAVPA